MKTKYSKKQIVRAIYKNAKEERLREINERIQEKDVLEDMTFDTEDRPHPDIQQALSVPETPLTKVPLPQTGVENQNFQELLASESYRRALQKFRFYTGDNRKITADTVMPLAMQMQNVVFKIMDIESTHKEELEQLAVNVIIKQLAIPEGAFQFDVKLIDIGGVDNEGFKQDRPNEQNMPEVDIDAEEELEVFVNELDLEKAKRRVINSMIQGLSRDAQYMFHNVEEDLVRITGEPDIISLYGIMMSANDLMYWEFGDETMQKASASDSDEEKAGKEEVDRNTNPPTIYAQGVNFPVLVHEIYKGVMEIFAIQGRPNMPDEEYSEVEESEDTITKEIWDLRLGPAIGARLRAQFPNEVFEEEKRELQNYLLTAIFKLPAKEFLYFTREVLKGSDKGRKMMNELMDGVNSIVNGEGYTEDLSEFVETLDDAFEEDNGDDINPNSEYKNLFAGKVPQKPKIDVDTNKLFGGNTANLNESPA